MVRLVMSYALASLILLSQVGVPLHMHYCKGMLESVSVLFKMDCDDHAEVSDLPACCQKIAASSCNDKKDNCCDDQVKVLTQEITSLMPQFVKWVDVVKVISSPSVPLTKLTDEVVFTPSLHIIESDSGPPIYILHQALIFYA
ncbi:MAG: hypothetical protein KBA14_08690 [Saprospiraceae bacterium]|nr:hypothetical protein [Saprospiraceae bacterium]